VVVSIVAGAVVFGVIAYVVAWFIIPQAPLAALHTSPSTT
jgi:phage shock protein PspC (stress-responsive transcriptional regulator)